MAEPQVGLYRDAGHRAVQVGETMTPCMYNDP